MLAASGELDPAIGGPSAPTVAAAADDLHAGHPQHAATPLLDAFDAPDGIRQHRPPQHDHDAPPRPCS